ncbi:unnamed protein product [Nesidiocoris tenuis]|uniref:Uncharacterized protein n=1 Tax=Nesidiocoris tenuis TaxID=355587 RepID=A0A6H5GGK8_9HEMI|nr:unnamed protein product [Nesidiocoris tenuis]
MTVRDIRLSHFIMETVLFGVTYRLAQVYCLKVKKRISIVSSHLNLHHNFDDETAILPKRFVFSDRLGRLLLKTWVGGNLAYHASMAKHGSVDSFGASIWLDWSNIAFYKNRCCVDSTQYSHT